MNQSEDNPFPFITLEDLTSPPVFSAAQRLKMDSVSSSSPIFPSVDGVILLHQSQILRIISHKHRLRRVRGFPKKLYLFNKGEYTIGIATNFGVGAPAVAVVVEELSAIGVKKLIALGIAGGLQADMQTGDIAICDRAIREEGTSYHYLLPSKYAFPSQNLTQCLAQAANERDYPFVSGASWTTDAPYRETRRKVEKYRQEGVLTVEMEAAALFAVCANLGIESGAAFILADILHGSPGQPGHNQRKTKAALVAIFEAAVKALEI